MSTKEMLFFASKARFEDAQRAFEAEHGKLRSWNSNKRIVIEMPKKPGKVKVKKKFWGVKLVNVGNWDLFRNFVEKNWNIEGNEVKGRKKD